MLKSVKILLLGDIHFPDVKSALESADYKDISYPVDVATASIPDRLANVVRTISRIRERDPAILGILLCGDLTSYGDPAGYRECVEYLNAALQLSDPIIWQEDQVHVVPGNHDVDRKLCGGAADVYHKFGPLAAAWKCPPSKVFTSRGLRHTTLTRDGVGVDLFSINSCIGCGEKRYLPEEVRDQISAALAAVSAASPKDSFKLVAEQLDTPAFAEADISAIVSSIRDMSSTQLPIILGHHNILPQASPRIALYTEAVNCGLVRSRLSNCSRSVVYCHGHIHTDPIEILQTPNNRNASLVTLSSPCLLQGFDILEVHFSMRSTPIGCTVHRYRVQPDGGVLEISESTARIPLTTYDASQHREERLLAIVQRLKHDHFVRFDEVKRSLRSARSLPRFHDSTLSSILLEAEWLGAVQIRNRNDPPSHWHIAKIQP